MMSRATLPSGLAFAEVAVRGSVLLDVAYTVLICRVTSPLQNFTCGVSARHWTVLQTAAQAQGLALAHRQSQRQTRLYSSSRPAPENSGSLVRAGRSFSMAAGRRSQKLKVSWCVASTTLLTGCRPRSKGAVNFRVAEVNLSEP